MTDEKGEMFSCSDFTNPNEGEIRSCLFFLVLQTAERNGEIWNGEIWLCIIPQCTRKKKIPDPTFYEWLIIKV